MRAASAGRRGPTVKEICASVTADISETVHPWTVARLLRALAGEGRDGAEQQVERRV